MKDVFDEDLMKELGLDPDDIAAVKQKNEPAVPPSVKPQAPTPASAPVRPENRAPAQPATPAPKKEPVPPSPVKPPAAPPAEKINRPPPSSAESGSDRVTQSVPVQVAAVMAKKSVTLKDVIEMRPGEVIDFKKSPQEPIDLVVNGKLVAKAELVLVDGRVGARILKLVR